MANKNHSDDDLKGTFYLVMALGVFIVVVWGLCFGLFLDRF